MFGDLLKAIELLLKALGTGSNAERKRRNFAKELLRIHIAIVDLVERGNAILTLLRTRHGIESPQDERRLKAQGRTIALLTLQLQAAENLQSLLSNSQVITALQVYSPKLIKDLPCAVGLKAWRVYMTLDELITDGHRLSEKEWMSRLESRMAELGPRVLKELHPEPDWDNWRPGREWGGFVTLERAREWVGRDVEDRMLLIATPEDIQRGQELLDEIFNAGERLREFIVTNFKIEEVL